MFVIPRSNLAYLNEQEKLHKPAFYILIGEDEATKPQAYIGETENFKERVKDHDSKKAFWQKALVFVSKDEDMTKADVQYLEYRAIAEAKQSNSFVLNENKQIPKAPNLPEHQRFLCHIMLPLRMSMKHCRLPAGTSLRCRYRLPQPHSP